MRYNVYDLESGKLVGGYATLKDLSNRYDEEALKYMEDTGFDISEIQYGPFCDLVRLHVEVDRCDVGARWSIAAWEDAKLFHQWED